MIFVRSLTVARSEILEMLRLWHIGGDSRAPFAHVILTPLPGLTGPSRVETVHDHLAGQNHIIFDSGGYAVQQGLIVYEDLYQRLLTYYRKTQWADTYILPDYVPTSGLSAAEVDARVNATIAVARLFYHEMPPLLQTKAMPVVQGGTREHIRACVEAYCEMGATWLGFGSFGTTGASNDINMVTRQSLYLLTYLLDLGARYNFRVHALGVGSPTVIPLLHELGVYSFDSSCWLRTAGFGNVLFPFMYRRNITAGRLRERAGNRPLTESELYTLQDETGHRCFFCRSFDALKSTRFYQILHNLTVLMDMTESLERGDYRMRPAIMRALADNPYTRLVPTYR